jgi:nitrite reductase/ring-hydroxylating ferredoxin subunit
MLPAITDAVYEVMTRLAPSFLDKFVPRVFPENGRYYFEHAPNVRFHIPFDLASEHRKQFDEFARRHGQGKIAPHGPHRDSWLDCPDNAINIWIAIGPVQVGNGLSIYRDDYDNSRLTFRPNGEIADGQKLKRPINFDLAPGDVVLFHSDQLHASELNRTDSTRYVVSYRITIGKPHFPKGHYHRYDHAGLARGPLKWFSSVPANLQPSYFAFRWKWLRNKLLGSRLDPTNTDVVKGADAESAASRQVSMTLPLSELPVGTIRAVSNGICVSRLSEDRIVAFSRRCPHKGADLSTGYIIDGRIVCPWHNLTFDPQTGSSPCRSLASLRRFQCQLDDGHVRVGSLEQSCESAAEGRAV